MKSAQIIRVVKTEISYQSFGTEYKCRLLSNISVLLIIFSMLMICAAKKVNRDENNTLVITGPCNGIKETVCDLIPIELLKGQTRVKLLNVNAKILTESMFSRVSNKGYIEHNSHRYLQFAVNDESDDYDNFFVLIDDSYDNITYQYNETLENITYLEISNVESLEHPYSTIWNIQPKTFQRLKNLQELHIHLDTLSTIYRTTFYGLQVLKTLNLNGCTRLHVDFVIKALKPPKLPSLENLFISGNDAISLTKIMSKRSLRKLDISFRSMKINTFLTDIFTPCSNLEYLNMSETYIQVPVKYSLMHAFYSFLSNCIHLTYLDISNIDFEKSGHIKLRNRYLKVLNISGIFKANSELIITERNNITREYVCLSMKNPFCNIQLWCRNQSVEVLELAENTLEFIAPDALACFENALTINLSGNQLFLMMDRHSDQFVILFQSLIYLENIRLSRNRLTEIPSSLFKSNINLKHIDLSSNKLQTINLYLNHLNHLDVLDLENNGIIVLDGASIKVIENLPKGTTVNLNSNPFGCSRCADLDLVIWLAKSKEIKHESLSCLGFKNITTIVRDALVSVQMMCDEEMKRRLSVSIPIAFLAFLSTIILMVYSIRRQVRRKRRQKEVEEIKMTIKGNERFAVFLTYSSEDDLFVHQYVIDNLNENLKLVIGTDRNLVCEGDRYFRLGKPILDEISDLLDRSDVLVAVVSNKYCQSVFCRNEFQLAIYKEMPILLMLKENVDLGNMSPSMRDIFERKTRVLWECEEGEYKLKTTWLNVCESVVEMIDIQKL